MADYIDIGNIKDQAGYGDFAKKVSVAIVIKAHDISQEATPSQNEIDWAKEALAKPESKRHQIENYCFADNSGVTITQMLNATDIQIQNNVNACVDNLLSK